MFWFGWLIGCFSVSADLNGFSSSPTTSSLEKTGLSNWKGRMVLAWAFPEPESATPGEYGPQQSTLTKDLPALVDHR